MFTAIAGVIRLGAEALIAKAQFVLTKLTGNLSFPTPTPSLATLTTAIKALTDADAAATDGGKSAHLLKNQRKKELAQLLILLAAYVTNTAQGDEGKIISAGFAVRKTRQPIGLLPKPQDVEAHPTEYTGQILVRCKAMSDANIFEVFMNDTDPGDEKNWLLVGTSTKAKFLKDGLTSGKFYWFRIVAIGTAGPSPVSDPAKSIAH